MAKKKKEFIPEPQVTGLAARLQSRTFWLAALWSVIAIVAVGFKIFVKAPQEWTNPVIYGAVAIVTAYVGGEKIRDTFGPK